MKTMNVNAGIRAVKPSRFHAQIRRVSQQVWDINGLTLKEGARFRRHAQIMNIVHNPLPWRIGFIACLWVPGGIVTYKYGMWEKLMRRNRLPVYEPDFSKEFPYRTYQQHQQ